MKRFFRWAVSAATTTSAVLCAAILAMWLESYHTATPDVAEFPWHGERWSIESHLGRIRLSNDPQWNQMSARRDIAGFELQMRQLAAQDNRIYGFGGTPADVERERADQNYLDARVRAAKSEFQAIVVPPREQAAAPYVVFAIIAGFLPAFLAARRLRHAATAQSRRNRGLCPACGYDLRATSGRCPECGTPGVQTEEAA